MFGILESFQFEKATRNGLGAKARAPARRRTPHPTSSPPYPGCARTPRRRKIRRSEAGTVATVHLRLMMRASGLGWCHAACAHSLASEPPSSMGYRLCRTSPPPRAHAGAPIGHEGRAKPLRHVVQPIKPLPFFPRTCPSPHCSPLPPAISAAGELATPLVPVANRCP
jgi:hypothetical protein